MKTFIHKTNQYLLENHPIIWNTKALWVLIVSCILHVLFFCFGYVTFLNPELLHDYNADYVFFENGTVFISIILSVLILVIWLFSLFKNNAFKDFYPSSRLKLFKQYGWYLIIIFCISTFYISYSFGVKSYINTTYPDSISKKDIEISNMAAMFFSESVTNYTINQRNYPTPFDTLFCETSQVLNDTAPHLSFLDQHYKFYTVKTKEADLNKNIYDSIFKGYIYYKTDNNDIRTYYYKDRIFDISKVESSAHPSYFNFSTTFYTNGDSNYNTYISNYNEAYYEYNEYGIKTPSDPKKNQNKKGYDLLKRNNPEEIKTLLTDFLSIADRYKIKYNLTSEEWFNLVYHPEAFELKALILTEPPVTLKYSSMANPKTAFETFSKDIRTDYYIAHDNLRNAFSNIDTIKENNPLLNSIHFFLWFTFFIASLIFMFRVTGAKPLIFTVITTGVLTVFIVLLTVLFEFTGIFSGNSHNTGYFASYLTYSLGTIILAIPAFFHKYVKKAIVAVCLNISIAGFIPYVFLILVIVSMHQSDACAHNFTVRFDNDKCFNLLGSLELTWSYILFGLHLIFIYFYAEIIKRWKALPEG